MALEPLFSEHILPKKIVVCIQVGRVIEDSIKHNNLPDILQSGNIATFDILGPEEYQKAQRIVYTTFFASQQGPATWPAPGVYSWPEELLPLTFNEQHSGGWIKHIQMKFKHVTPLLTLEENE